MLETVRPRRFRNAFGAAVLALAVAPLSVIARVDRVALADWIYTVEVAAGEHTSEGTKTTAVHALGTVVQRVSGTRERPLPSDLDVDRENIDRYFTRTSFVSRPDASAPDEIDRYMSIEFDPSAIVELVRKSSLPVWSAKRPVVVLWLVVEGEGGPVRLADKRIDEVLWLAVTRRARERGLPVVVPLGDVEDRSLRVPELARAGLWIPILEATQRHSGHAVAVARFSETAEEPCLATGTFLYAEIRVPFKLTESSLQRCGNRLVDSLANALAERQAVEPRRTASVDLEVSGVGTALAFSNLISYLRQWEFVDRAKVLRVQGDVFVIRVVTAAPPRKLERLLGSEGFLRPTTAALTADDQHLLHMHWLGDR